jgi:hypothetical protein
MRGRGEDGEKMSADDGSGAKLRGNEDSASTTSPVSTDANLIARAADASE